MAKRVRIKRIGFDLDGVIIDKPFFVPRALIEYLYKGCTEKLNYKYPESKIQQKIRTLSHHHWLRKPIEKNLNTLRELKKLTNCRLYVISSRYWFLNQKTREWLKIYKIDHMFDGVYINKFNEQPHLFKLRQIEKLKLGYYIEDSDEIRNYLKKQLSTTTVLSEKQIELLIN